MDDSSTISLKILVAGAGIGGLTAALALRRQGHHVEVFEAAPQPNEIGAAINIVPNAFSVLNRLGVNVAESGGVILEKMRLVKASGEVLNERDMLETAGRWQGEYRMTLRPHLHEHLRKVAASTTGVGPPVRITYSKKAIEVDHKAGILTFADGSIVQGDVVVGADGVHSNTRSAIDHNIRAKGSNHNAFRFLVAEEDALADPRTVEFFSSRSTMDLWYAGDRKVVVYRCANNTLLNFVCIHPAHLSSASEGYNTKVDHNLLLDIFKDFHPKLRAMLEKANAQSLRVYPLYDMETLPTFVNGRVALVGDAAHPFLPHLGQGGAMAIEDGVSLGVMLSNISSKAEVPIRIKLYNDARYKRATQIQNFTRIVGGDGVQKDQTSTEKLSLNDYLEYALSHDEQHNSMGILQRHIWRDQPWLYRRQPIKSVPMPDFQRDSHPYCQYDFDKAKCTTAKIVFKTSATLLKNLFPSFAYSFTSEDTVAYASFRLQFVDNLAWLGGAGNNRLELYIHNVQYREANGKRVTGTYLPVVFEDPVDAIPSKKEEFGLPIVYSNIGFKQKDQTYTATLSWRGTTWAEFIWPATHQIQSLANGAADESHSDEVVLIHSYKPIESDSSNELPNPGQATTLVSDSAGEAIIEKRECSEPPMFSLDGHDCNRLPTLHNIVSSLAEMPVMDVVESSVVKTKGIPGRRMKAKLDD